MPKLKTDARINLYLSIASNKPSLVDIKFINVKSLLSSWHIKPKSEVLSEKKSIIPMVEIINKKIMIACDMIELTLCKVRNRLRPFIMVYHLPSCNKFMSAKPTIERRVVLNVNR